MDCSDVQQRLHEYGHAQTIGKTNMDLDSHSLSRSSVISHHADQLQTCLARSGTLRYGLQKPHTKW
jgi:hypothetical protein